jgi:hypothetical protein
MPGLPAHRAAGEHRQRTGSAHRQSPPQCKKAAEATFVVLILP